MGTAAFRGWFADRLSSAELLVECRGEAATSDAEILLCCAISALAAQRWPGRGIDRARFVQFLVDQAGPSYAVESISTPLLASRLYLAGDTSGAISLREAFFPGDDVRILAGREVDLPEADVLRLLPYLEPKLLREQSYASLIYTGLRSHLVHEHSLSSLLSSFSHAGGAALPDYTNMTLEPDPRQVAQLAEELGATETAVRSWCSRPIRQLHFPYTYLRDAMVSAAQAAFDAWDTLPEWEVARPGTWWIEGT